MKWLTKAAPTWVVLVLLAAVIGVSVAWAASEVTERKYATMAGEVVTVTEEVSATPQGITVATADIGANEGTLGSPIIMTTDSATANNAVTKGHYVYKCEVAVVTVTADAEYTVKLLKDGTQEGNLIYIGQAAAPAPGDKVTITWDIVSFESAVYQVEIMPVP